MAQKNYELVITKRDITSTDPLFDIDNLHDERSKGCIFVDAYFEKATGIKIRRSRQPKEQKKSNQVLPRLAFQVFEKNIAALSEEERKNFPTCKYDPNNKMRCGIFKSEEEFHQKYGKSYEFLNYNDNNTFYIYCWNIYSTLYFVWECLKRFGDEGDKFVLIYYRENETISSGKGEDILIEKNGDAPLAYQIKYSKILINSKNVIFRGAPGTGKTYLAKKIAADIVTKGKTTDYEKLTDEQKEQIGFVQFHPSYDYSDFVEGLRPAPRDDGTLTFELKNGIFKEFVERAKKNKNNVAKTGEQISIEVATLDFLEKAKDEEENFETINHSVFSVTDVDEDCIWINIPDNEKKYDLKLKTEKLCKMIESEVEFKLVKDLRPFFGTKRNQQEYSYYFKLYTLLKEKLNSLIPYNLPNKIEEAKDYVFIIDEINRGEISKIFGELFFSIDPGYRGEKGKVATQYSNLHDEDEEDFYIPDNVYIIGTMNDIDRSVDTFDFAMRRRFRFIEIKADENVEMLDNLPEKDEAIARMERLNKKIAETDGLNENYQIGAAYFKKLENINGDDKFEQLWNDYLEPLLQDYVTGMYNDKDLMKDFKKAYNNETDQN